jgi:hypothetical protein
MSLNIRTPDPKQVKVTWRDVLPIHPAAELFPLMSESELRELGEDIRKNGLQSPIVIDGDDNRLIDGRNRLDAITLVGMKLEFKHGKRQLKNKIVGIYSDDFGWPDSGSVQRVFDFQVNPFDLVISANLHRRHLTSEQKRELIAKVLKAKPEASDRQIAKQTKTSPTTVGKIRKESEVTGDVSKLDTRTDTKGRKQPSAKPKKSAKPAVPAKTNPIIVELDRSEYSERVTKAPEISEEQRRADPDDIVGEVIRLIEKMTVSQRRDLIARLQEIPDDLSIPAFLRRSA